MTLTIAQLHRFLLAHYNLDELKTLCVDLAVEYDDLGGEGRAGKARELALYMERHGRLIDLQAVLSQQHEAAYREAFGETATRPAVTAALPHRQRRRFERNSRQIFVSHATADAEFAHRLANDLRREGYAIWIAPESIPDGQWVSAINRGLAESGVMLLVLTPAALESPWVEMETNVAIELERAGEMRFIPVCLVQDRYDPVWHAYQWVMFNRTYGAGWRELAARLGTRPVAGRGNVHEQIPVSKPPPTEKRVKEDQWRQLQKLAHEIAAELGRQSGNDETREVFRQFNRHFGLTTYKKLPRKRFDEGLGFLTTWRDRVAGAYVVERHHPTGLRETTKLIPGDSNSPMLPSNSTDLVIRDIEISSYVRHELIGEGAAAYVYKVSHSRTQELAALKILKARADPYFRVRFEREGVIGLMLNHPNIVKVFGAGKIKNIDPYILMEYISGRSLRERLVTTITLAQAITIIREVCLALDFAHAHQVIHGDVKPENILFTDTGLTKIGDFGISSVKGFFDFRPARMIVGSPEYLSYEEASGLDLDGRSDQYSLGIVFYEMLTGRPPFLSPDPLVVIENHLSLSPVPPSKINKNIPRNIEQVILRSLSKEKKRRYPTMSAMAEALG